MHIWSSQARATITITITNPASSSRTATNSDTPAIASTAWVEERAVLGGGRLAERAWVHEQTRWHYHAES